MARKISWDQTFPRKDVPRGDDGSNPLGGCYSPCKASPWQWMACFPTPGKTLTVRMGRRNFL